MAVWYQCCYELHNTLGSSDQQGWCTHISWSTVTYNIRVNRSARGRDARPSSLLRLGVA
jgi:hypothetical protein